MKTSEIDVKEVSLNTALDLIETHGGMIAEKVHDAFEEAFDTDGEAPAKKIRKIVERYRASAAVVDDLFISLCGYCFETLVQFAMKTLQEENVILVEDDGNVRVDTGILEEDGDTFLCGGEPVTFDHCEKNCPRQSSCDTYAWASDDAIVRNGGI